MLFAEYWPGAVILGFVVVCLVWWLWSNRH